MPEPRVLILGVPRAGKSTLAARLAKGTGLTPRHTDDLIALGWHHASERAALWLDEPGPWIIEGVAAVRALRKWLRLPARPGAPATRVLWLGSPRLPLTERQDHMAQGTTTIWREVLPELQRRRVTVESA
jgi:adenylate kinase family enzyme